MEARRRRKLDRDEFLDSTSPRRLKFATGVQSTPLPLPKQRLPSLENLPEDLLHKIVSQLTVREAGRTSILSSRWRKRWIHHSNLCFDGTSELAAYDTDRFLDHVTTVLQRHSRVAVDKFEVRSPALGKEHARQLDRWIGIAASSKAKYVIIDLSPPRYIHNVVISANKYKLPVNQLHFENNAAVASCCASNIVSLLLGNLSLELPTSDGGGFLGFKALKKLELKFVVDLGDLTPFLSNCPALEWLSITRSSIPHLVVPQICCLNYLQVGICVLESIELHAKSLKTFEYRGCPNVPIKIMNVSLKLSEANINLFRCSDAVGYFWDELACSLCHVDRLFLSFDMDRKTTRLIQNPTKFVHLRHLTLFCHIFGDPESALVILRLTQILEAAPQLEHFVLHMDSLDWESSLLKRTGDECIRPQVHNHLKTVLMTGVFGLLGQLELAKYILLSARALEFMTLNLAKNGYPDAPWEPNHTYFLKLEKLAKNYLDPLEVYRDVLKIIGL